MDLKNINLNNSEVSKVKFDLGESADLLNLDCISSVVNWQLAKKRSGSAKVKTMAEISGTTAKPHKQKGTGHARQGSKRSVQMRGGRACFGPVQRSFEYSLPKKLVKKTVRDVLRSKIIDQKLVLVECGNENLKTRQVNSVLAENGIDSVVVVVAGSTNCSLTRSTRNISNVKVISHKSLNVYDMLKFNFIALDKELFETIKVMVL